MTDLDSRLHRLDPCPPDRTLDPSSELGRSVYRQVLERVGTTDTGTARAACGWWSPRRIAFASLAVVVCAGAVAGVLAGSGRSVRPHGSTPTTATTAASPPTSTVHVAPPVSRAPWPLHVLVSDLDLDPTTAVTVPGTPWVLGFEADPCMEPCAEPLVKVNVDTGSFQVGPALGGVPLLDLVDGAPVVVLPAERVPEGAVFGGWELRTVDLDTLGLGPVVHLPSLGDSLWVRVAPGVPATGGDVWMGGVGQPLALVDPSTGRVVRQLKAPGKGGSLAISPDGDALYVLGEGSGRTPLVELSPATGAVLARTTVAAPQGSPTIVATDGGVWTRDNRGHVVLLSADGLRPVPLAPGALPPGRVDGQPSTAIRVTDLGDVLLLTGYRGATCLDPDTGALRATAEWSPPRQPDWLAVAASANRLSVIGPAMAVGGQSNYPQFQHKGWLASVVPPAACFG